MILTTARLTMTPVGLDDEADLVALFGDPAFTEPLFGPPMKPEEVWSRLLRDLGHWQARGYGNWSLRLTGTGEYVGQVGLLDYRRTLDPPFDAPEVGWGLRPAMQGKGYGIEAVTAAVDFARERMGAQRTVCMIGPGNSPSLALAARTGFAPYAEATYAGRPVVLLARVAAG